MQVNKVWMQSQDNKSSGQVSHTQELGKDDFLQLLVTQLRFQDPMEPIKEREFIAQLAQFSTLEGVNNLSRDLGTIADLERALLWQSADQAAVSMLGCQVTLATEDGEVTGIVKGVRWHGGRPQIVVEGQAYDLGYIQELKVVTTETNVEDE